MHMGDNNKLLIYVIDSLSLNVSLEWKASLVVVWF